MEKIAEISLIMRLECEVKGCRNRAIQRKFFVDEDGFWTALCESCYRKITKRAVTISI